MCHNTVTLPDQEPDTAVGVVRQTMQVLRFLMPL